jgi:hypothetical protein
MFIVPLIALALLLLLLLWTLRPPRNRTAARRTESIEEPARHPASYLGLIRQAMSPDDLEFLAARAPTRLVRRAYKERRHIAILYLADLRTDFQRLMRLARIITVLSPKIARSYEMERLRLSLCFYWHYRLVLLGLYGGFLLVPQLSGLSQIVSNLAFRLELAMNELGERAAVAAELGSTLNRRGLDVT